MTIDNIMRTAPVIPVLVIDEPAHARPIAQTLVSGGLAVLEVTLRTDAALEVIREMTTVPGAIVGAGTVLNPRELDKACAAGARFIVAPGLTEPLARAALERDIPFLPGVATAGDVMRGLDLGLDRFKFFPAEASGGRKALAALAAPFRGVRFCPTGGVTTGTAAGWLFDPHVLCVGGTWLVSPGAPDLEAIHSAAMAAAELLRAGEAGPAPSGLV